MLSFVVRLMLKQLGKSVFPGCLVLILTLHAGAQTRHRFSGIVVDRTQSPVAGASIKVQASTGMIETTTDQDGKFDLQVPDESLVVQIEGKNLVSSSQPVSLGTQSGPLRLEVSYSVPPIHDSIVIEASALDPSIDRRNEAVFRDTLFSRDDQVFFTLDAGINAGQHEGGGKSLEIRRFGFNLDHGGVNGGLKVLVDNVQQNQGTQGHGQGYLGQLKSLTPELVQEVNILNGPFSAEYGDFSGLGVVHIRLRESLADQVTARFQGGAFNTFRSFLAYSPDLKTGKAFIAYELSRTDGPFLNPLSYKRDNITGNFTKQLDEHQAIGFKFNFGRNDYTSSGQLPLDLIDARELDRFGFIDPTLGGNVRSGTAGVYYRREWDDGRSLKVDGFLARSLFDLYSNFTFFLNDEVNGDQVQQHDSRLQGGVNAQYLHPYKLFGQQALFIAGGNFHDNSILVSLSPSLRRAPIGLFTKANAHVTNWAGYVQQGIDFWRGRVHLDVGGRIDYFRYQVTDQVAPEFSGTEGAGRFQPKVNLSYTPTQQLPLTFSFNYGRGITSQDARGVVQQPEGPKISTTDFYQLGLAYNTRRFSVSSDVFLIDRSNEQVYIPDDGSIEFQGPSRAYGVEVKTSAQLARHLNFNAGLTHVGNVFFRGTGPRVYVDSAPRNVANAALTFSGWNGLTSSLRFRYIDSYRLDGEDPTIMASGLTVLDFSLVKQLTKWVDLNVSVDNLTNKRYFETQNYFESRVAPGAPVISRVHATPGYPITWSAGVTFHLFRKD